MHQRPPRPVPREARPAGPPAAPARPPLRGKPRLEAAVQSDREEVLPLWAAAICLVLILLLAGLCLWWLLDGSGSGSGVADGGLHAGAGGRAGQGHHDKGRDGDEGQSDGPGGDGKEGDEQSGGSGDGEPASSDAARPLSPAQPDEGPRGAVDAPDPSPPQSARYRLATPRPGEGDPRWRGQPGGPPAAVSSEPGEFFGIKPSGTRIAYVVDRSSSMIGWRFELARRELINSLEGLEKGQQFFVVFFNIGAYPQFHPEVTSEMLPATATTLERVLGWIRGIVPGGGTDPRPALDVALALKPDTLLLLSDGEFDPSVRGWLKVKAPPKLVVYTISLDNDSRLLAEIAAEHGGAYRLVPVGGR